MTSVNILIAARRHLMNLMVPVVRLIGKWHAPFSVKKLKSFDFKKTIEAMQPGDAILSHVSGVASNAIVPGYWKHIAFVVTGSSVIEAIGNGVVETDLLDFIMTKDAIKIVRPIFATAEVKARAVAIARGLIGLPYDYLLEYSLGNNKAFYCSEVIWYSYETAISTGLEDEQDFSSPFTPRLTLGMPTITPQDFANARSKWSHELTLPDQVVNRMR